MKLQSCWEQNCCVKPCQVAFSTYAVTEFNQLSENVSLLRFKVISHPLVAYFYSPLQALLCFFLLLFQLPPWTSPHVKPLFWRNQCHLDTYLCVRKNTTCKPGIFLSLLSQSTVKMWRMTFPSVSCLVVWGLRLLHVVCTWLITCSWTFCLGFLANFLFFSWELPILYLVCGFQSSLTCDSIFCITNFWRPQRHLGSCPWCSHVITAVNKFDLIWVIYIHESEGIQLFKIVWYFNLNFK